MIKVTADPGNIKGSVFFELDYNKVGTLETVHEALDLLMREYPDLVKETDCYLCGTYDVLEYDDHIAFIDNFEADMGKVHASFREYLNECETRAQERNKLQEQWDALDQKRVDAINKKIELSPFDTDRLLEEMDELQEQIDDLQPADIKKEIEERKREVMRG